MSRNETAWPRDPYGFQFILRSFNEVGRLTVPADWTGNEALTPPSKMPLKRPILPEAKPMRPHPADNDQNYKTVQSILKHYDREAKDRLDRAKTTLEATRDLSLVIPGIRIKTGWDNNKATICIDPTDEDWARAMAIYRPWYEARLASFRRAKAVVDTLVRLFEMGKVATFYRPLAGGELIAISNSWWRSEVVDGRFDTGQLNPARPFESTQRGAYIFTLQDELSAAISSSRIVGPAMLETGAAAIAPSQLADGRLTPPDGVPITVNIATATASKSIGTEPFTQLPARPQSDQAGDAWDLVNQYFPKGRPTKRRATAIRSMILKLIVLDAKRLRSVPGIENMTEAEASKQVEIQQAYPSISSFRTALGEN
jgi:hypothetical protein